MRNVLPQDLLPEKVFYNLYAVSWKVPYVAASRKTAKLPQSVCLTSGNFEGHWIWFNHLTCKSLTKYVEYREKPVGDVIVN